MSAVSPTAERTHHMSPVSLAPSQPTKPQRVLACILCQQRKVKCDRKHPCANCIKTRAQCIPATQVSRQRRRRFPERELLERLRKYEDLLRQNNIKFEPLHRKLAEEKESPDIEGGYNSEEEQSQTGGPNPSRPSTIVNSERLYEAKNIWHAVSEEFRDPENNTDSSDDDVYNVVFKSAWDQVLEADRHLLFGTRETAVDISTLHPEPVQIFRLWQLYLENVNPLLKVTHTPSLQGRIIEAASNILNITPTMEALMFSIYSMSILSLDVDECQAMFGSSQADLLTRYHFGCQQALLNCSFLRCEDRECLTAFYLYLVSVRPSTVPQSLSSMLGIAIRIAQRMGIHSELVLAKCTALEAELRRRLWWSLILFDTRIGEMADFKTATLTPIWDCKIPLNVNDSDFRLEMKEPPKVQGKSTEALFAVVRSELGDFVRHTMFHLGFTSLALKPVTTDAQHHPVPESSGLANLEKTIEDKYFKFCDPGNPLHFMTIWTTRGYLAKCRLVEHHFRFAGSSLHQAEAQRDAAFTYSLRMLECDTNLTGSTLTKGFLWQINSYFPFTAYIRIGQHLKWRPIGEQAEQAWQVMSDNYQSRGDFIPGEGSPFLKIFTNVVLQAWEAREATFKQPENLLATPRIVSSIRQKLAEIAKIARSRDTGQPDGITDTDINNLPMSIPIGFGNQSLIYGMGEQDGYVVTGSEAYTDIHGLDPQGVNVNQLDWSVMDWNLVNTQADEPGEAVAFTGLSQPY